MYVLVSVVFVCVCVRTHARLFEQDTAWKSDFSRLKTNGNGHLIEQSNKELTLIILATFLCYLTFILFLQKYLTMDILKAQQL